MLIQQLDSERDTNKRLQSLESRRHVDRMRGGGGTTKGNTTTSQKTSGKQEGRRCCFCASPPQNNPTIIKGWREGDDKDRGVDKAWRKLLSVATVARIAMSTTRTMEQRGAGEGGDKEEVNELT